MAYITESYYKKFGGREIPASEFDRLEAVAADFINGICHIKPCGDVVKSDTFKRAVCYQLELLYEQGGEDAILGASSASLAGGNESLGDYSVSAGSGTQAAEAALQTVNGIPISPMALMLLRQLGLMSRWVYDPRRRGCGCG